MMGALVIGVILSAGLIAPAQNSSAPAIEVTRYLTAVPTEIPPTMAPTVVAQVPAGAAAGGVQLADFDAVAVEHGRSQFQTTCAGCHGSNARGIPGLGKDLVQGDYVRSVSDEEMTHLIIVGRQAYDPENSTGVTMPARGGNPMLTDDQIREIVVYLRASAASELGSVPAEVSGRPDPILAEPAAPFVLPITALGFDDAPSDAAADTAAPDAAADSAASDAADTSADASAPSDAAFDYNLSCAGCHGLNGEGVPNNGIALIGNPLLINAPDAVIAYLTRGQPPIDPRNDFPHPIYGDGIMLTQEEVRALVEYARELAQ
jgi:disulfide bond formation protein DsbB